GDKEGDRGSLELTPTNNETTIYRLDAKLLGANKNAKLIVEDRQDYYERYYLAHTPEEGVQAFSYRKIIYQDIYPHIDWVLYVQDDQLKYDFVVRPGGNVKDIRLQYQGATGLNLQHGALTAITPYGSITEAAPYSYEAGTGKPVQTSYVLQNDLLEFVTGPYTGTLIIDPVLDWATYYGDASGSGTTGGYGGIATDAAGFVYISGRTGSTANIATTGTHQTTINGATDCYIAQFNSLGVLQWGTYYGGNQLEYIYSMACDAANMLYFVGTTYSTTGIATTGAHQPAPANPGHYDGML